MRSLVLLLVYFFAFEASAGIQSVKLDSNFSLKYDNVKWAYQYIKALSPVTPHILESKNHSDLKVIIQNETHAEAVGNKAKLVSNKCSEAQKFYKDSNGGSARKVLIKNVEVCFIEQKRKEKNVYQLIYPVSFSKNAYNLISFAWQDKDEKFLADVSKLIEENI